MKFCEDCKNLSDASGNLPRYWMCIKHPLEEENFLSRDKRISPPYKYCKYINIDGNCPDFEERKVNGI